MMCIFYLILFLTLHCHCECVYLGRLGDRIIRDLMSVLCNFFFRSDEALPTASLRLLAPPLRLVSAAVWKVMQQRDAMHYGKLEEFVTSVSETVPGLLSYRHQAKLCVGLRARVSLTWSLMACMECSWRHQTTL